MVVSLFLKLIFNIEARKPGEEPRFLSIFPFFFTAKSQLFQAPKIDHLESVRQQTAARLLAAAEAALFTSWEKGSGP